VATAYIALGANLGDRAATLRAALRGIAKLGRVTAVSSLYETDPVGFREQPRFLNAVAALQTALPPLPLLLELRAIELKQGRTRSFRNAPRTLDLDLLLYDELVLDTAELTVPHPRLHERAFVLVPLAEIAPETRHPVREQTAAELLAALAAGEGVRVWAAPGWDLAP
jgi:2-amino-4-hydroxy-6-hydroxymethyldihydropteridine diphosphokinase